LKWLEISVRVDSEEAAGLVCQVFDRHGEGGAVQEQVFPNREQLGAGGRAPVAVKTYLPLDGHDAERLRAIQTELSILGQILPLSPAQFKEWEETEWTTAWKAFFQPRRVGKHVVLKLPEQSYPAAKDDIVIDLEPGMAFGTGLHATTRMCLACLEGLVQPGDRVLDMGTGSGVLSLAAARLGAAEVLALDHDSIAVAVATENVIRNHLGHAIRVEDGSLEYLTSEAIPPFDGIAMNIITEVIVEMMGGGLTAFLKPGGWLVASGILLAGESSVRAAFGKGGMLVTARYLEEEWIALCGKKAQRERP
jgi:ribosomal protein L11 methyltransferase